MNNPLSMMAQEPFDPNSPMFPISVAADILKVHQRTLRIYDDENILVPGRTQKNRRQYSINDIEKGKFIQHLTRNLGVNLAGIKIIIELLKQLNISENDYLEKVKEIALKEDIISKSKDNPCTLNQ